ncbi:MAG: DUF2788 domain-containing protein [Pseudomonadales bacterium]|nr:DUF2788 domain-containing protein [Pseudomonadales bacterium]
MTEPEFAALSLKIGLPALILYMVYIMYRLAKDSNAGKIGTFAIFLALGFGILGFVIKEVLIFFVEG